MCLVCETTELHTRFYLGYMRRRPRSRWKDNTEMDLEELGWGSMDWIDLAPDKDKWRDMVNAVMNQRAS
jgi:hypothetical protein